MIIKKWNEYQSINENIQRARAILRRAGVTETNEEFQKLRKLLATNPGYLGKFTEWLIVNKITYDRLEDLYQQIKDTRLSRPIDEFKTPEEIIDTIVRTTADTAVNQMIHAIPSKAREFLKNTEYCDTCDNEKEIECETCENTGTKTCSKCDGESEVDCPDCRGCGEKECSTCKGDGANNCKKCKGKGTYYKKECPDCDGEGTTTCEVCDGDGEINCKTCNGGTTIKCDQCDGEGGFDCDVCKLTGMVKCPSCDKESDEWKEFVKFLSLQAPHKDIIIDFLSKKGGRYSNEDDNWDYDDSPLDELTSTITRLIDLPSVDTIIEKLPNEPNLRLIYNDDKVLIVAANYDGVYEYGSSFWCIHQDESTFNDYVYERNNICQQWIVYFKEKTPLVDEKSVMGITYNIAQMGHQNGVEYADWEDDGDCVREAKQLISGLKIDKNLIIGALEIFEHDTDSIMLKYPEAFLSKIEKMFDDTKLALEEFSQLKTLRVNASYTERNKRQEVEIRKNQIIEMINNFLFEEYNTNSSYGEWTPKLTKIFTKICREKNMKIPTTCDDDFAAIAITELYPYFDYDAKTFTHDIFEFLGDNGIDGAKANNAITWLVSNGYNIKPYLKSNYLDDDYLLALYKLELVTFDDFIRSADLDNIKGFENDITIAVLDNTNNFINDRRFSKFLKIICDVLVKNTTLFGKYKQTMLDLVAKINKRDDLEMILDKIDDDDLEMACARKLLHRKILTKYDVEMKKKMLEKLVLKYDLFKKI